MGKPARYTLIVIGGLLAVILLTVLILPYVLNLEKVRALAESRASEVLGREVRIDGAGFKILPGPRVNLKGLSVAESPQFGDLPFASLDSFDLSVRILPLLGGRLEVAHITLVRPKIRVIRNREGRWNYSDIMEGMAQPAAGVEVPESGDQPEGEKGPPVDLLVKDIRISDGEIFFADPAVQALSRGISVDRINVQFSDVSLDRPIGVSASAGFLNKDAAIVINGKVGPVGEADPGNIPVEMVLRVPNLELAGLKGVAGDLPVALSGVVRIKESVSGTFNDGFAFEQEAKFEGFRAASRDGAPLIRHLTGHLDQRGIVKPADGTIVLHRLELAADKAIAKMDGMIRNPGTAVILDLNLESNPVPLENLVQVLPALKNKVELSGDMAVEGKVRGTLGKDLTAEVKLASSRLEVDRGPMLIRKTPTDTGGEARVEREGPMKPLPLAVRGVLTVREGRFERVNYTDLSATVSAKGTKFALDDMSLRAFGGQLAGSSWADLGQDPPAYGSRFKVRDVEINEVLSSVANLKGLLYGRVTSELSISGQGTGLSQMLESITGMGDVTVGTGRFTSANLLGETAAAASLLGLKTSGSETPFDDLNASFAIDKGKMNFRNLRFSSSGLKLKAVGTVGLDRTMSLKSDVTLSGEMAAKIPPASRRLLPKDSQGRTQLPIIISGSLTSPSFALDSKAMGKAAEEAVQRELEEQLDEELEEMVPEDLKKDLGDALKKLF